MNSKGKKVNTPSNVENNCHIQVSEIVFLVSEAICILFFGLFTEYTDQSSLMSPAINDERT